MAVDLKENYDKIYSYCYIRLHNRQIAEDITQETFLKFLENRKYQEQNKELQYLYTIAKNLCIDEYRKQSTDELKDDVKDNSDCESEIIENIALSQALEKLPQQDREIIFLRYVNELPLKTIGKIYNISRFALNRKIKKSLATLKALLDEEDLT